MTKSKIGEKLLRETNNMGQIELYTQINVGLLNVLNVRYDGDLKRTRGLYCSETKYIYINLNASQFLFSISISIDVFIKRFIETIVHETTHSLIDDLNVSINFTSKGEETVCETMGNQR